MISVMNSNDFDLDTKSEAVKDEPRLKPRVSEQGGGVVDRGEPVNVIGSENDARGLHDDFVDTDDKQISASMELGNSATESRRVRVSEGDTSNVDNRASDYECKGTDEEMDSRVSESTNKDVRLSITKSRNVGNGVVGKKDKIEPLGSQYDSMLSMFDEFAANGRGGMTAVGPSKPSSHGYEIGDMVWGKVKSHPWWPGQLYNEDLSSPSVQRSKRDGYVLVAFFGDSSYGWFDPAELIPFESNFAEKSRQTLSRAFVKAVEEAVDEASRRSGLALTCKCRNKFNFRPSNVQGCFAVDVVDYEPGAVYTSTQIKKARDSFVPRATLAFIKQLALASKSCDDGAIHFIKNKATAFAYRKAVFEEFDETYAQAFGYQPERPSPRPVHEPTPGRIPPRAPLSGRLVIAETLGKGKSLAKPNKAKDPAKKDKYLFKRRDEPSEIKAQQINEGQAASSPQPVYVEGSLTIAPGDYVLQKRSLAVTTKTQIPGKHEESGTTVKVGESTFGDVTGSDASVEAGPAVIRYSNLSFQMNANKTELPASSSAGEAPPGYGTDLLEKRLSPDKEKGVVSEVKEGFGSDVAADVRRISGSTLVDDKPRIGDAKVYSQDDMPHSKALNLVEGTEQTPGQEVTVELPREHQVLDGRTDSRRQKDKVRKRSVGELSCQKPVLDEKKKKKKRKKDVMRSDGLQIRGKDGVSVAGKVASKPVQVAISSNEGSQMDQSRADVMTSTSSPDAARNIDLELLQLRSDLQALALDPFHGVEESRPAVIRQVFLKFRSLVYQKSLALSPPEEDEANEAHPSKNPALSAAHSYLPVENSRALAPGKPQPRPSIRPDDPTKGGRKRAPSDRQEEIAAKKKQKVKDLKNLSAEKKVLQKIPEAARADGKQAAAMMPKKGVEAGKKTEQPPSRASEPTMLVMKFPTGGSLPSSSELKARFARFGPMDHSGTRIFWKTFTCRVVYKHRSSAEAAYKFVVGSNPFGNTEVKCHIREVGVAGAESEPSKVQREDAASGAHPSAEQRSSAAAAPMTPGGQLKSCLKKSGGEEAVGGNARGTSRVKFMLGGEETSRGAEPLTMVGNRNNIINNNAVFADGGASSSSHASSMDYNSKNFQKTVLQQSAPSTLPLLPLPSAQFIRPQSMPLPPPPPPRTDVHNPIITPPASNVVDIAPEMMSLLTQCNDVVNKFTSWLGYVPYHSL